jgi:hypothetical protein
MVCSLVFCSTVLLYVRVRAYVSLVLVFSYLCVSFSYVGLTSGIGMYVCVILVFSFCMSVCVLPPLPWVLSCLFVFGLIFCLSTFCLFGCPAHSSGLLCGLVLSYRPGLCLVCVLSRLVCLLVSLFVVCIYLRVVLCSVWLGPAVGL